MRVVEVSARAFGGIADGTLEPAPGLTVVYGPNEAGKSTWHSAVFAAICGIRRGPGMRSADKAFKEKYLPWSGDKWVVECVLDHTDGRRIRIHRDLEGKIDDRAEDVNIGRDVSNEIINDGAPDASRWLGLDRNSFLATACIRQAEVVSVAQNAELLQEYLERGVATAGTDATAARALQCISDYQRDHVGLDRAGTRKPLRAALDGLTSARDRVETARRLHAEYLELDRAAGDLERKASEAGLQLAEVETLLKRRAVSDLRSRVTRAREISDIFVDGPPSDAVDDDDRATRATEAVTRWKTLREAPVLEGETAAELEARVASLPMTPSGDLAVASEVRDSRDAFLADVHALRTMEAKEPRRLANEPSHGLSGADIRELARAASTDVSGSQSVGEEPKHTSIAPPALVVTGVLAMLIGALIAGFGALTIGLGLAAVGLITLVAGIALRIRHRVQRPNVEEIAAAVRAHEAASRKQHALDRLRDAGLPNDAFALGQIADEVDALAGTERRYGEWALEMEELKQVVAGRESDFRAVLAAHCQSSADDVVEWYAEYERECSERAASALMAAGREDLEARLAQRRDAEQLTRQAGVEREAAKELLVASAAECGIEASDSHQIVSGLGAWLTDRRQSMAEHEAELKLWAELETVLRGSDLESLEAELHDIESQLSAEDRSVEDRPDVGTRDLEREAARLRVDVEALRRDADQATGRARERANQIPSVADAEEDVASAEAELERVRRLQRLLATTTDFLSRAEEKAHRNVAPKLKKHLETWLPVITDGRHSEVAVDVDTLVIRVREDGALRPATSLSHGTAEQIYLLLRIALVEHLVGSNGPCPLLFDDVTVQSDAARTVKIMEMLLTMSHDTQIIVFSQEEEVRRWAEATLHPPSNLLLDLTG